MTGDRMPWHVFGLVFLVHAASLWTGEWEFIFSFDDGANFLENEMIQELSLSNLIEMTKAVKINVYEPLAWMLKAMVHAIWGMESRYVRLVSLALHWSACAMWSQATTCLLGQLFDEAPSILECSLAAILYGVHPIHIESTIWPSAQPYPLAMLFTSICFWAFIHPTWPASKAIAAAAYLCAVLSKSIALFLPVGLVMIDFALENIQFNAKPADYFRYCRRIACIILIFVCMLAITINANQGGVGDDVDTITLTLSERIAKMFIVFIWPLQALIWPVGLRPHYRVREVDLDVSSNADVLLSVAATFMISLSLFLWKRKLFAAWIYYIAMLLPVSGLVQHGMVSLSADRYAYFPTVVFIPMAALGLRRWHITQVVMVFALLLGLTLKQMQHWRREENLWQYCITQDPADWRMLDQLAEYYLHYRRNAEAVPLMERSAWFGPKRGFKAQLFQAKQRMLLNFVDEGCTMYDSLATAFPQSAQVWNNLAVCRLYKGEPDVAREMWETAMQLQPPVKSDLSIPWNNLRQLDDYLHKQSGFRAQLMW